MYYGHAQTMRSAEPLNEASSWHDSYEEGQLAIDVLETEHEIIVVSTMAGARTDEIDVQVQGNDLLTIRGVRPMPIDVSDQVALVHQECFWGRFSRTVVLPSHVMGDAARADYKNGVLCVRIPKRQHHESIPIDIIEE